MAAGSLSNYAQTKILGHLTAKSSWTMPTKTYLGLCTASPTAQGTGALCNEEAGTGYARVDMTTASHWAAATSTVGVSESIANTDTVAFTAAGAGDWTAITHWALFDQSAVGTGNMIAWGAFTNGSQPVGNGAVVEFTAGQLTITLT